MRNKVLFGILIIGLTVLASLTMPAFAQDPPANQDAWQNMHNACQSGDWDTMIDAAKQVHGDDFNAMPCGGDAQTGGMMGNSSGHMNGGMMGATGMMRYY